MNTTPTHTTSAAQTTSIQGAHPSLKLLILGATRGTGRALLEQALEQGHTVTVLARDPARLDLEHPRLRCVQGDAEDYDAVRSAVRGQDAVLSALGAPALKRTQIRFKSAQIMCRAMEDEGVERLISLSVLGLGESRDALPLHLKYLIIPLYLRRAFDDHALQEEQIKQSRLRWTLVRPPTLTDGARTGIYAHGFPTNDYSGVTLKIARADVADFMLRQLTEDTYVGKAPGISYAARGFSQVH